jgi:DNA-binding MurR/RpiR family transcriptional regulator
MLQTISEEQFNAAVDILHNANSINIVGTHYNYIPALYAANFLKSVRTSVNLINTIDVSSFSILLKSSSEDAILAISTARYPTDTQKILNIFKDSKMPIIAITDSEVSPIVPMAKHSLIVPMKFMSYIDPFCGIMVLIHSIVNAIYIKNLKKTKNNLVKYNQFIKNNDLNTIKDNAIIDLL